MVVTLNGEQREIPTGATIASVLELLAVSPGARGIAVAVQGEVIPRGAWESTELRAGARVEVVAAIQGG